MARNFIIVFAVMVVLLHITGGAVAQSWTGADPAGNLWSSSLNWNPQTLPGSNDVVDITAGLCHLDSSVNASCFAIFGPGWYNSGLCELTITGGSLTVSSYVQMGSSSNSNGRISISNGTLNVGGFYIGYQGTARIYMTGGTINATSIILPWINGTGRFDLYGGTVNAGSLTMADNVSGSSRMDITSGTLILDGDQRAVLSPYIQNNWIVGHSERSGINVAYTNGKTVVTAASPDIWAANNPIPADGAQGVEVSYPMLNWAIGAGTSTQNIYFGISLSDVNNATPPTPGIFRGTLPAGNNSYAITESLTSGTTYYWRVDELSSSGHCAKGNVWSFTATAIDSNAASVPNPRNGAGYFYPGAALSWKPGGGTVLHRVYWGDDYNDVAQAMPQMLPGDTDASGRVDMMDIAAVAQQWLVMGQGLSADISSNNKVDMADFAVLANHWMQVVSYKGNQIGSSYTPDVLELGKNYFWRVDEVLANGYVSKGPVWALTTASSQHGVIVAASDANNAAWRLKTLIAKETGLDFTIVSPGQSYNAGDIQFVLCTKNSRFEVQQFLPVVAMNASILPQGFLLSTDSGTTRVSLVGADTDGLRYGVGELWHYHCTLDGMKIIPQTPMWLVRSPAYSKRLFWNWTGYTNWDDDLSRVHQTLNVDASGTLEPYLVQPNGFVDLVTKMVDFQADHKLNGMVLWGFINDAHGGLTTAKALSKYAKNNAVRILPGIGSMGYGGFYSGGTHPYNVYTFMNTHPEVRRLLLADGNSMPDTPCPSDSVFQQWIRDGAQWYFGELPDIGGINLEHGDYFQCYCSRCQGLRALPENDHNYYWDMMYSQLPIVAAGLAANPDLWCTYAAYDPYDTAMMNNPPKFLGQYPTKAITQWTYTKMIADPLITPTGAWPLSLHPPAGTNHSIGLLHQGSHWDLTRQWWGVSNQAYGFGGTYALISDLIQWTCQRAIQDNSEGIELIGQIGVASPQNELNYLALEAFTWNPQLDYQTWIDQELAPLYGGSQLSRRFYELVSSTTVLPQDISGAIAEAQQIMKSIKDPRQARRWNNLILELQRRLVLRQ